MLLWRTGILAKAICNSGSVIKKIPTVHHKNLDLLSWKSWPFIMKIFTVCNKISTVNHENKPQLLAEMALHIYMEKIYLAIILIFGSYLSLENLSA